ncbi:macroglobulin / complement [Anaeramoeba flamelloides]|uniref:Macroglobulin / complement n=1 Tax=Anaeramoeba flamelloides TaxID=1746091 RepID=A0ABQ8XXR4_9EUKA|nr:macroglobulin / complement [Anaeramoeba flamelloides]
MGNEQSSEEKLKEKPRFSVHISTDKDTYKPGETLYCRAILLDCFNHKPLPKRAYQGGYPHCKITNSKDEEIFDRGMEHPSNEPVISFQWEIPEEQKGGEYTIEIYFKDGRGIPKFQRTITIRKFTPKRFKTELKFKRKGYAAGETVKAQLKVERTEGGIPDQARVTCTARLDEQEIYRKRNLKVDEDGLVDMEFQLPEKITVGVGSLNCVVTEGGVTETASKTLPVVLKKMDINIYPEGGDLVNGLPCGVYVEASNIITGDPADFEAILIERSKDKEQETDKIVEGVEFKTLHEGRGRFEFQPKENYEYYLKPTKPQGLDLIKLPQARENGISLRLQEPGKENYFGEEFTVLVNSNLKQKGNKVKLGLYKREETIISMVVENSKQDIAISLSPKEYDGVLRITAFDTQNRVALAERLIFVQPRAQLTFNIETEKKNYSPGDEVTINIGSFLKTINANKKESQKDEKPKTAPRYISVTVTDDSVYQMKEKRNRAPRLPEMYFLENEVKELKDPRNYLFLDLIDSISADQEDRDIDQDQEIVPSIKVDLLLGTQGWRKFVYYKPREKYNQFDEKDDKDRLQRLFNVEYQIQPRMAFFGGVGMDAFAINDVRLEVEDNEDGLIRNFQLNNVNNNNNNNNNNFSSDSSDDDNDDDNDNDNDNDNNINLIENENVNKPMDFEIHENDEEKEIEDIQAIDDDFESEDETPMIEKDQIEWLDEDEDEDGDEFDDPEMVFLDEKKKVENYQLKTLRIYAHQKRENWNIEKRTDFTNTLYFSNFVQTTKKVINSQSEFSTAIKFDLNDEISSFRVFVDGFDEDGNLGCSQSFVLNSQKPFYIEPKLPSEITGGDQMLIPITIVNSLDRKLNTVLIKGTVGGDGLILDQENSSFKMQMKPLQRIGHLFAISSQNCAIEQNALTIIGKSINPNLQDKITRKLLVKTPGFPHEIRSSGMLKANSETETFQLQIPKTVIRNSIKTSICVYPSPSSNITESLKSLIRQPCGCFEQTSNTVYPMVMAIQYMKNHENDEKSSGVDEKFMETAYKHLESGYKKLVGYECSKGGFEWFGGDPAHEALTSMGIMEFSDMRKIWDQVDDKMLKRTTDWILSRRDEETGGFKRNTQALDSFGRAPKHTTDAYIVWALTKAGIGYGELERQFEKLEKDSKNEYKDDSYYLAMVGLALHNVGFTKRSKYYADALVDFIDNETGEVQRSRSSITNSRGSNLSVETTSVAMLLWMEHSIFEHVSMANKFIHSNNNNGRFGSTQATVLALMALIKYDQIMSKTEKDGKVNLIFNDEIIQTKQFVAGETDPISFDDIGEALEKYVQDKKFDHNLKLQMIDGCNLPFSFFFESTVTKTLSDPEKCSVIFNSVLNVGNKNQINEGEGTEIKVNLKNRFKEKGLGMVIAIIGLPAGLQPRYKKLLELKKTNVISHFELFGVREVVFYWRCMAQNQEINFTFDVIAEIPGTYYGSPSRAYVYYDDDNKYWNDPFKIEIVPKIKN